MKKKWFGIAFNVAMWTFVFLVWKPIITNYWETSSVKPPLALPSAIASEGAWYEYCVINKDTRDSSKAEAGTPIPSQPVIISTPARLAEEPVPTITPTFYPSEIIIPTASPTPAPLVPTSVPPVVPSQIDVVKVGKFDKNNWHFVFVGVGFGEDGTQPEMTKVIGRIQDKFSKVNVDFAYLQAPVNLSFNHIENSVRLNNMFDGVKLFGAIKIVYPVDGMVIIVNTTDDVGSAAISPSYKYAIFGADNPYLTFVATHEMGHLLRLDDGYRDYYPPNTQEGLPNKELFFADSMPRSLTKALDELGDVPPMYPVGTCLGRDVYRFYPNDVNIYGTLSTTDPDTLNKMEFTPLQIIEMDDYILNY